MSAIHNIKDLENTVEKIVEEWDKEIVKGHFFKINLLLLENIFVDYFGTKTAIKYLVSIKKDGKGKVYLVPFETNVLDKIHQALLNYETNWQISVQGEKICISQAMMTTKKKETIIKNWREKTEKTRINIRNIRHLFLNYLKNEKKIGKEELMMKQKKIQKIIDEKNQNIEQKLKAKINDLLNV